MDKITLDHVLPKVFVGSEKEPPVVGSGVWLQELEFTRPNHYIIEAESGAGKSSLCAYIYGSRTDYQGRILFDGRDIRDISVKEWTRLRQTSLGYLPQEMRLFPELTAMENIEIKNSLTGCKTRQQIIEMLNTLEVGDKVNTPAARLSVGQQQRVAIIRALCQPFDFLLIDEPVSHLDARNNQAVSDMIIREATERKAAILATSVGNKINIPDYKLIKL